MLRCRELRAVARKLVISRKFEYHTNYVTASFESLLIRQAIRYKSQASENQIINQLINTATILLTLYVSS